ncbi:unnamed protein product [Coregonus sp. 'balchen']|nr:unnamed protein product [Coregonus sp. 'balchen']
MSVLRVPITDCSISTVSVSVGPALAAFGGGGESGEVAGLLRPALADSVFGRVLNVSMMTKTPPNRRGIYFKVGAQLEARDSLKNWCQANIEKIEYEDQKVLIHYCQWSHRYDEWFGWTSPYLRPLERIQLRREDCRYYPAKVLEEMNVKARERDITQTEQSNGKDEAKVNGKAEKREGEEEESRKDEEEKTLNGNVETSGQNGNLNGEEGETGAGERGQEGVGEQTEEPQAKEDGQVVQTEREDGQVVQTKREDGQVVQTKRDDVNVGGERVMSRNQKQEEKKEDKKEGVSWTDATAKEEKARHTKDRSNRSQSQKQVDSDSVTASQALTPDQTSTEASIEAQSEMEAILKRQVHLPTTHKYSREPLYRVIKNQPPQILSIELDHNPFKCKAPGCLKSFRKASLLHYHVKYYHADSEHASVRSMQTRASEKQAGSQETPRRRRTMSGSIHSPLDDRQAAKGVNRHRRRSLSERRKENQHTNSGSHDEREWGASETENTNTEENMGISLFNTPQSNPNLASKFPISHKHKLSYDSSPEHITDQVQEDDESDWSTVSTEWSDEDMEAELHVTTPVSEQNVSMVTEGSDVVRCILSEYGSIAPAWASLSTMCLPSIAATSAEIHQLLGDVHHVFDVLNGLQLKMSILRKQTHSDLKLWRQPWKQEEELGRSCGASPGSRRRSWEVGDALSATSVSTPSEQPNRVQKTFQDSKASYISSEHCYQKPWAYYPAAEQRLVVETRGGSELEDSLRSTEDLLELEQRLVVETRGGSELEDSLRSTEDLLELEQRYGGQLHPDRAKLYPSSLLQDRAKIHPTALQPDKGVDLYKMQYVGREVETEEAEPTTDIKPDPDKDSVLHQQWQINLLDHIEAMQNQSRLDYTGELEPPDPLTRLPQLKHCIRQMVTDLDTVQQMSLCFSNT